MIYISDEMYDNEKNKPLQATKLSDIEQMTDDILNILKMAWGKNWGRFYEAYPITSKPEEIIFPAITFTFDKMEPGEIGNNGRKDIKPKHRGFYREEDGVTGTEIRARIIDAYITFYCWGETTKKANKLARDFMVIMDTFTGYLKERGIQEIRFIEMVPGERDWNSESAINKEIRYRIRYEEQYVVQRDLIQKIITNVSVGENEDTVISVIVEPEEENQDENQDEGQEGGQ